ncbi:MAG: PDZ domain-containing protein, partial [Sporomusaceae bacterium]|nr:PDZ domain-containing protein [Sporomusaceae bacterium]
PSQLADALTLVPAVFVLELMRNGRIMQRKISLAKGETTLGVILVPSGGEIQYIELVEDKLWIVEWFKKKVGKKS